MKIFQILLSLVLLTTTFISFPSNTSENKNQKTKKEPIIKITNNSDIISKERLEKIDPKTIKSIDISPDTVFITLHDKMKNHDHIKR